MNRNKWLVVLILLIPVILVGCAVPAAAPSATDAPAPPAETPSLASTTSATSSPSALPTDTIPPTLAPTSIPALPSPTASPSLTVRPSLAVQTPFPPTGPPALNDLRYRLIAQFGAPFYCDPDLYPVGHDVSDEQVAQYLAEIRKNPAEYAAILRHLGLPLNAALTPAQQRAVYGEQKMLNAVILTPAGTKYQFGMSIGNYNSQGTALTGLIDASGGITVTGREPAFLTCPICLAADTLIGTPSGQIPVQDVRAGTIVWTLDSSDNRVSMPVAIIARRPVGNGVRLILINLADGRQIFASPGHPTTDRRLLGDLLNGDFLDGSRVVLADRVPYAAGWTYDILPSGETGTYLADGIWLMSTLRK